MNDQPAQPEPNDSAEQTAELEAQVDVLLAEIERHAPEAVPERYRRECAAGEVAEDDVTSREASQAAPEHQAEDQAEHEAEQGWGGEHLEASRAVEAQHGGEPEAGDPQGSEPVPHTEAPPGAASDELAALDAEVADAIGRAGASDPPTTAPPTGAAAEAADSDALAQQIQDLLEEAQAEAEGLAAEAEAAEHASGPEQSAGSAAGAAGAATGEVPAGGRAGPDEAASDPPMTAAEAGVEGVGEGEGVEDVGPPEGLPGEFEAPEAVLGDASGAHSSGGAAQAPVEPEHTGADVPSTADIEPMASPASEQFEHEPGPQPDALGQPGQADRAAEATPEAPEAAEPTAPDEPDAWEEVDEADPNLISRIDEMLAEEAEDVLSVGEFESVSDLLEADAASGNAPGEHGSVESADPVAPSASPAASAASSQGATAADVARELDDQPEQRGAAAEPPSAPAAMPTRTQTPDAAELDTDSTSADARPARHRRHLAALAAGVRWCCGLVNAPLYRFSPEVRATIGWIGVMTLFNALCLMLVGLLW